MRLNDKQRQLLAEKFGDLAVLVAVALVFGQLLSPMRYWDLVVLALVVDVVLVVMKISRSGSLLHRRWGGWETRKLSSL